MGMCANIGFQSALIHRPHDGHLDFFLHVQRYSSPWTSYGCLSQNPVHSAGAAAHGAVRPYLLLNCAPGADRSWDEAGRPYPVTHSSKQVRCSTLLLHFLLSTQCCPHYLHSGPKGNEGSDLGLKKAR